MDIKKLLKNYERIILLKRNRKVYNITLQWKKEISSEPGVYAFFYNNELVYVGESKSLMARMGDVRRTVNHTLRRKIGDQIFSEIEGFENASSKKKFPEHIEILINEYMGKLLVSILPIAFGRCEVEEYLITKYSPRFNSKSKRKIA